MLDWDAEVENERDFHSSTRQVAARKREFMWYDKR